MAAVTVVTAAGLPGQMSSSLACLQVDPDALWGRRNALARAPNCAGATGATALESGGKVRTSMMGLAK